MSQALDVIEDEMAAVADGASRPMATREDVRNLAIIAHVDHGKTTLVDKILKICGTFRDNQQVDTCVMDSNDLERERGITILAKNCAVHWKGVKVNILDTPGHADFGGEVERVLRMADGCLLLVDAAEGPLPQTRFVLRKAFEHGLRPIVVLNKIDRKDARPAEVLNEVYDLFIDLDADEKQLEFPVLYGSGRDGYMMRTLDGERKDIAPLMETILSHIPGPRYEKGGPVQFLVSSIEYDDFIGRIALGRVFGGTLKERAQVLLCGKDDSRTAAQIKQIFTYDGIKRVPVTSLLAGDIACIVGIEDIQIADSVVDPIDPRPMPYVAIEPPTITMMLYATDSPFRGQEGKLVTSRQLKDRLERELKRNVALRVEDTNDPTMFKVAGRGLLHLGVLLETMRREGYEMQVGKPEVILRQGPNGEKLEPFEMLVVRSPEDAAGKVIEMVGKRRGVMVKMEPRGGHTSLEFKIPARGLIGLRTRILNASRGEATMHHIFHAYEPYAGEMPTRQNGVLIASDAGDSTPFAMFNLKDRGTFFVDPGAKVYVGQIVGENAKENDLVVNVVKKKHLTNIRAAGADEKLVLPPARLMSLEEALEYIEEDELVEITPMTIRLRKKLLDEKARKRADR